MDMTDSEREQVATRLLTNCEITQAGCWEWTLFRLRGYGRMSFRGAGRMTHRLAYAAFVGPFRDGEIVCHHCDNPPCINPDHLYLGTPATNGADRVARGRHRRTDLTKRGHIRQRGDSWEVRAYAGATSTSRGRTITRTVKGTEKAAGRALTKLLGEIDRGDHSRDETITVLGLSEEWVNARKAAWSPATLNTYQAMLRHNIVPRIGAKPIATVAPQDLERLYGSLPNLAPAALLKVHSMLHTMFGQAVRWGWIDTNPVDRAQPPKTAHRQIEPPTVAQVRALLAVARGYDAELGVFLHIAAATAARRGELCALRYSDLDDGTLTIRRAVVNAPSGCVVKSPKTGRARALRIDTRTVAHIDGLWAGHVDLARDCGVKLRDGYLFAYDERRAKPWNPVTASHRFAELRDKAKLPGVRLHDIRHYAATVMLDAGIPIATVAERGGWANAGTLLRTYAHRVQASDDAAADLLGGLLD